MPFDDVGGITRRLDQRTREARQNQPQRVQSRTLGEQMSERSGSETRSAADRIRSARERVIDQQESGSDPVTPSSVRDRVPGRVRDAADRVRGAISDRAFSDDQRSNIIDTGGFLSDDRRERLRGAEEDFRGGISDFASRVGSGVGGPDSHDLSRVSPAISGTQDVLSRTSQRGIEGAGEIANIPGWVRQADTGARVAQSAPELARDPVGTFSTVRELEGRAVRSGAQSFREDPLGSTAYTGGMLAGGAAGGRGAAAGVSGLARRAPEPSAVRRTVWPDDTRGQLGGSRGSLQQTRQQQQREIDVTDIARGDPELRGETGRSIGGGRRISEPETQLRGRPGRAQGVEGFLRRMDEGGPFGGVDRAGRGQAGTGSARTASSAIGGAGVPTVSEIVDVQVHEPTIDEITNPTATQTPQNPPTPTQLVQEQLGVSEQRARAIVQEQQRLTESVNAQSQRQTGLQTDRIGQPAFQGQQVGQANIQGERLGQFASNRVGVASGQAGAQRVGARTSTAQDLGVGQLQSPGVASRLAQPQSQRLGQGQGQQLGQTQRAAQRAAQRPIQRPGQRPATRPAPRPPRIPRFDWDDEEDEFNEKWNRDLEEFNRTFEQNIPSVGDVIGGGQGSGETDVVTIDEPLIDDVDVSMDEITDIDVDLEMDDIF